MKLKSYKSSIAEGKNSIFKTFNPRSSFSHIIFMDNVAKVLEQKRETDLNFPLGTKLCYLLLSKLSRRINEEPLRNA